VGGRVKRKREILPAVPCALADVPIGMAVMIGLPARSSIDDCTLCGVGSDQLGRSGWHQVTFKIGDARNGSRNLRALFVPPSDPAWIHSPDHCHLVPADVVVVACELPYRPGDVLPDEVRDPLTGLAALGPLFAVKDEPA
jgi:hypothetical protein